VRTAIKSTVRVERSRAPRTNTAPPMPPMPDPKRMSSRSFRVGFACNAQAAHMTESVTCDVADWESLVSMRKPRGEATAGWSPRDMEGNGTV
jgi:hypothetical protein